MRPTIPLNHAKYFWWGKGFGNKPGKNTDSYYYKLQWKTKSKRLLDVVEQTLPEGVVPIDANDYVKKALHSELGQFQNFKLPWPYSPRPIKGSKDDPDYKEKGALVFQRNKRLLEPIKLPLYFTNSILENDLPLSIKEFRDKIKIDNKFVNYCQRRFEWALNGDSALRKLPLDREFPYLDQKPPRVYGTVVNRKENHLLQTLYDISSTWYSKCFGFNPNVILQRISNPNNVLAVNRDDKFALLDLNCDFMTLLLSVNKETPLKKQIFDPNFKFNTENKLLESIHPISWEVAFDMKNFYRDDFEFKIPVHSKIQTIFLSNNHVRKLNDDDYQGRGIMFCYGYAMQQAKLANYNGALTKPITIQCLYTSPKEFKIGFVLFQLNTTNFDDQLIRNQVWLSPPRSLLDETHDAIIDVLTMQSFHLNQISK